MKKMKKLAAGIAAAALACSFTAVNSLAAENSDPVDVYVTISDSTGKLVVTQEKVTVTDIDNDGALTINDALYIAHENSYEGGAEAGYGTSVTQYGLGITKLWGTENGGSYGYYVNNASAWSLSDVLKTGDYLNAFVYTDTTGWSDKYTYFDSNTAEAKQGDELTLTLSQAAFDADYSPITLPVEGASITINGVDSGAVTDAEGKATITLAAAGNAVISATSDSLTLVPPVCIAAVAENPDYIAQTTTEPTETTSVAPETETTTAEPEESTTAKSTNTTTKTTAATTTKPAGKTESPKTGDGSGIIFAALGTAVAAAFLLRKHED
ncbi:MAG: hypothetical protein IJ874_08080 [Ruminococcus sp.]|nr:hypothetical protein [Ruminococcus sp.]